MRRSTRLQLLRVPTPSQQSLSLLRWQPRDLKRWIAALPKANIGETARQLYQSLVEFNPVPHPLPTITCSCFELLRPEVSFVCQHLERHFLKPGHRSRRAPAQGGQPCCQALQNHLAVGYQLDHFPA